MMNFSILVPATLFFRIPTIPSGKRTIMATMMGAKMSNWNPGSVIARKYFERKGIQVEIIKLYGSVELAPVLGIADEILDLTSTGRTLKENNLVEMDEIFTSTARVIANVTSYRTKYTEISNFIKKIKSAIK